MLNPIQSACKLRAHCINAITNRARARRCQSMNIAKLASRCGCNSTLGLFSNGSLLQQLKFRIFTIKNVRVCFRIISVVVRRANAGFVCLTLGPCAIYIIFSNRWRKSTGISSPTQTQTHRAYRTHHTCALRVICVIETQSCGKSFNLYVSQSHSTCTPQRSAALLPSLCSLFGRIALSVFSARPPLGRNGCGR